MNVQTPRMSAPKRMLLKHLRYNSPLHSFLSPRVPIVWVIFIWHIHMNMSHIHVTSENPFREMGAFQNGSAWIRSDADAAHMRKASSVIQMRQTRQMQMNKDACIGNWTDEFTSRDSHRSYRGSQFFFGDSSVTLAQWWRALHLRNLVTRRSPVRFRPKTRQLRFTWMWANRPSSKGSNLLFLVIKAI